jgi:hypothetical protein
LHFPTDRETVATIQNSWIIRRRRFSGVTNRDPLQGDVFSFVVSSLGMRNVRARSFAEMFLQMEAIEFMDG